MLLELIIFAVVLVSLQTLVGVIVFKLIMSDKFISNYTKKYLNVTKEIVDDLFEE